MPNDLRLRILGNYQRSLILSNFAHFFTLSLRKKCPYSELPLSVSPRIQTECGEILRIPPYSVLMRENTDQNNSEYGQFFAQCVPLTLSGILYSYNHFIQIGMQNGQTKLYSHCVFRNKEETQLVLIYSSDSVKHFRMRAFYLISIYYFECQDIYRQPLH